MHISLFLFVLQPDPLVSVDLPIIRADRAIEAIGKSIQVNLRGSGGLLDDYVYFNFKGIPLSEVKEHLALLHSGEWTAKDGVWTLHSAATGPESERAYTNRKVRSWFGQTPPPPPLSIASVDKTIKEAIKFKATGSTRRNLDITSAPIDAKAPTGRLLTRILLRLGSGPLESLQIGDRVVYSNNPTPMQKAFPPGITDEIQKLRQELGVYSDRLALLAAASTTDDFYVPSVDMYKQTANRVGGVELALERTSLGSKAVLRVLDAKSGEPFIRAEEDFREPPDPALRAKFVNPFRAVQGAIKVTPEHREWLLFCARSGNGTISDFTREKPTPQQKDALLKMDEVDLLERAVGPIYDQFVEASGKGLMTIVTDAKLYTGNGLSPGPLPSLRSFVGSSLIEAQDSPDPKFVQTARVNVILPSYSDLNRATRFDRGAIVKALKAADSGTNLLRVLATLAVDARNFDTVMESRSYLREITGRKIRYMDEGGIDLLKMLGRLSAHEWSAAEATGINLNLGNPSLPRMTFGHGGMISTNFQDRFSGKSKATPPLWEGVVVQQGSEMIKNPEVTRVLGDGIAPDAAAVITIRKNTSVYGTDSKFDGDHLQGADLADAARTQARREVYQGTGHLWGYDTFTIGSQESATLELRFPGKGYRDYFVVIDDFGVSNGVFTPKNLPEPYRTQYQSHLAEARRIIRESPMTPDPGPRTTKSPPRR